MSSEGLVGSVYLLENEIPSYERIQELLDWDTKTWHKHLFEWMGERSVEEWEAHFDHWVERNIPKDSLVYQVVYLERSYLLRRKAIREEVSTEDILQAERKLDAEFLEVWYDLYAEVDGKLKEFVALKLNYFVGMVKGRGNVSLRTELNDFGHETLDAVDQYRKEVAFFRESFFENDADLIVTGMISKVHYFVYDVRILEQSQHVSDVEKLLVNYDFLA